MSLRPLISQKPLSGSAPTTWLNANTSSWQSKAEGLLVDFPVFLYRSPVYTGWFQSLCGTWPIHHASVKNCNEAKIPSQLQPIKVAYYSLSAGGLHETLEEKQRKPDFSVQKNCGVSAFWGLTPQAPLHIGQHREWDSKDGLCYRRDTNPELRKLQRLHWRGEIPTPCSKVGSCLYLGTDSRKNCHQWLTPNMCRNVTDVWRIALTPKVYRFLLLPGMPFSEALFY